MCVFVCLWGTEYTLCVCVCACVYFCANVSFYIKLCAFVCLTFMLAWTSVVVCVCVCLLHAGPSVQGDNKHISPQSEAKQALPDSHQLADDHRFVLASSRLGEAVVVVPLQDPRGRVDVFGVGSALGRVSRVYLTTTDRNVALLNILSVNLAFDASAALFRLF